MENQVKTELSVEVIKIFKIPLVLMTIYFLVTPVNEFIAPIIKALDSSRITEIKFMDLHVKLNGIEKTNNELDQLIEKLKASESNENNGRISTLANEIAKIQALQKKNIKEAKVVTIDYSNRVVGIEYPDGRYIDLQEK